MFQLSSSERIMPQYRMKELFIVKIEENSDPYITRYRVYFENGHILSVIRGFGTYGNASGLFEVCLVFDKCYDNILGYLNEEDVVSIIREVGVGNLSRFGINLLEA